MMRRRLTEMPGRVTPEAKGNIVDSQLLCCLPKETTDLSSKVSLLLLPSILCFDSECWNPNHGSQCDQRSKHRPWLVSVSAGSVMVQDSSTQGWGGETARAVTSPPAYTHPPQRHVIPLLIPFPSFLPHSAVLTVVWKYYMRHFTQG